MVQEHVGKDSRVVHRDLNGDGFSVPVFSMKEVRDAIPPHCHKPNTLISYSYLLRDLSLIGVTAYGATFIHLVPSYYSRALCWTLYTVLQGMFGTGIWGLAHECGHGAFTEHKRLQDFTGWVLHSTVLAPYFSWQITHRKHHANTGNMDMDNTFVPQSRERWVSRRFGWRQWLVGDIDLYAKAFEHMAEDTPLRMVYSLFLQQVLGWPLYLLCNTAGKVDEKHNVALHRKSHFYFGEDNILFNAKRRRLVLLSDIGLLIDLVLVYLAAQRWGWWNVTVTYLIPVLWVNHWLVAIAYLNHTDPVLPHYKDKVWSFAKGAAATVDRDFGFIGRHLFHRIIETHVLHHSISTIPHYHAEEASAAMRKVMGMDYRSDTKTNFLLALWRVQRDCKFVEESEEGSGVFFFRNMSSSKFDCSVKPMRFVE